MSGRGKYRRCFTCKRRLKLGDAAFEVKVSEIRVKGGASRWNNSKVLVCEPCHEGDG